MTKTANSTARRAALLLLSALALRAQGEFWGELKAGRFGVGFRAVYQSDPARSYDAGYPSPGKPAAKRPRPILVAIWYPAPPDEGKAMVHRDYLRAITLDSGAPEFAPRLRKYTRDETCHYMIGKEYDDFTDEDRARCEGLLSTPVFAVLSAPAIEGKFPIVLYHPGLGGTYEDNAVACEYLASHGFVVVSSAYQSADSSTFNIDGDLETSFADLAVLLRFAATLPFADPERVAAIGHSYGAQAMIGWRALPDSPLDAVVFLDSAVLYAGLDAPQFARTKAAVERNPRSAVPVLFFADRDRHPHFETFDPYLKFAPHYEATTPALDHNAFVAQGVIGKDEGSRRSYEAVCAAILKFLEAYVKEDAEALKSMQAPLASGPLHVRHRQGAPPPPTGAQIARLVRADAPGKQQALTALIKSADPDALIAAAALLFDGDEKKQAADLLKSAARQHSRSAVIQESLAEVLKQTGDPDGALAAYDKALELIPADESLSADEKTQLRQAIEAAKKK
jgi:dienelactone hydrolase